LTYLYFAHDISYNLGFCFAETFQSFARAAEAVWPGPYQPKYWYGRARPIYAQTPESSFLTKQFESKLHARERIA